MLHQFSVALRYLMSLVLDFLDLYGITLLMLFVLYYLDEMLCDLAFIVM